MKFDVRHRYSGAILFSLKTDSFKLCVEAAVKSGANLSRANLSDAYLTRATLSRATLSRANLSRANLYGAHNEKITLVGERPFLQLGPMGSRCAYLLAFLTDAGIYIRTGCFWDTLKAFKAAVKETHGTTIHGKEYGAAIKLIEAHAKLWTPKKEKGK